METGNLKVINGKTLQINFINSKGKSVDFNIKDSELSGSLLDKKKNTIAQLNGIEVEFNLIKGQPQQVKEKGKTFDNSQSGDFHNPYNFVPALPRDHLPRFIAKELDRELISELGDGYPSGHGSYRDGFWSGKISVSLTTVTPLLIPDAANLTETADGNSQGHKTYPIRLDPRYLDANGKPYLPYLPPTSIKGMLRSAYEAVTNSRLSIFVKHEDPLAFRMSTNLGIQMIPARIEQDENGNKRISLFPGTSSIKADGTPSPNLMYAAWLPRYRRGEISPNAIKYPNNKLPEHQQEVEAWVEKFQHWRWDKRSNQHIKDFQYWRVRKIVPLKETLGDKPDPTSEKNKIDRQSHHQPLGIIESIRGFVCITNQNIDKKHDERVFFNKGSQIVKVIPKDDLQKLEKHWQNLITNYQEIHEDEICKKHKDSPPALNNSVWSRHIKGVGYSLAIHERTLKPGTLCYARIRKNDDEYEVLGLYPVIIARELFKNNPLSLLPEELRPALSIDNLSPADRVFGWVNQETSGSYKGQLRINSVKCKSDNSIKYFDKEPFKDGLPLAILGEPKPEQARFYVAKTPNGEPLKDKTKTEGYQKGQGLRGRKVYPHHQLTEEYWSTDSGKIKVGERYREYLRPDKKQDKQNRTIKAWVEPKTTFTFDIEVINLSNVELGALLWLLSEVDYHRLGGGKPLGFGSIKLSREDTDLRTGKEWKDFYGSLIPIDKPQQTNAINSIECFKKAVEDAYENTFDCVSFIAAFSQATTGFAQPIHYPRTTPDPKPEGESFEWFVLNESGKKDRIPLRLELPSLTENQALYLDPTKQK